MNFWQVATLIKFDTYMFNFSTELVGSLQQLLGNLHFLYKLILQIRKRNITDLDVFLFLPLPNEEKETDMMDTFPKQLRLYNRPGAKSIFQTLPWFSIWRVYIWIDGLISSFLLCSYDVPTYVSEDMQDVR